MDRFQEPVLPQNLSRRHAPTLQSPSNTPMSSYSNDTLSSPGLQTPNPLFNIQQRFFQPRDLPNYSSSPISSNLNSFTGSREENNSPQLKRDYNISYIKKITM